MLAFIPVLFPLVPLIVGAGAGAATVAVCNSGKNKSGGGKKAEIAALKARIEALERKP